MGRLQLSRSDMPSCRKYITLVSQELTIKSRQLLE